jgi:hypothetical protein
MHRPRLNIRLAVLAAAITGCTPPASQPPTLPSPLPAETGDTAATRTISRLSFSTGRFQYRLQQNTRITALTSESAGDTAPSTIITSALLLVEVSLHSNSGYDVVVSIDSLEMSSEGRVLSHSITQVHSLGPVLQASFTDARRTVHAQLPDSLCGYSQFVTAAHKVLLLQLPTHVTTSPTQAWRDTIVVPSCRAGTRIEMQIARELKHVQSDPLTLALEETAELNGGGMLQRDSVTISGSITTHGRLLFADQSRLPAVIETQSEGSITVRLAGSTTIFRQNSAQRIEREDLQRIERKDAAPPN